MFQDEFEELLMHYPDSLDDKRRFIGLLKDFLPDHPMQRNLIGTVFSLGIVPEIQNIPVINNAFAFRFVKQLMEDYGVSRANADWAVSIWCVLWTKYSEEKM